MFVTSSFNALIVGNSLPLLLENKNSIHVVSLRINLSGVPSAAEQERHSVTEALATAMRYDGKRSRLLDIRWRGVSKEM